MPDVNIWKYIASAMTSLLFAPPLLILLPQWKYPLRKLSRILLLVELFLVAEALLVLLLLGRTEAAVWIIGYASPATAFFFLIRFNSLRGGRLVFLMVTIILDATICDVLSTLLFTRDCPQWIVCHILITLCTYFLLYRFCRKPLHEMLESSYIKWGRVSIIPLSLYLTLSILHKYSMLILQDRAYAVPLLCLCVTAVLIYICLRHFQQTLLEQASAGQYNALLQSELRSLETQNNTVKTTEEKIRIFRHDARHYLRLLQGCLDQGQPRDAMELVEKMKELADTSVFSPETITYTGNHAIDTILNQARELARAKDVSFTIDVRLPEHLRMDTAELAVILSNALDNAILAASASGQPGRQVLLHSRPHGQGMLLAISNTFAGALVFNPRTSLPATQEEGRGYGMLSIYSFAKKYDCMLDCTARDNVFCLQLII